MTLNVEHGNMTMAEAERLNGGATDEHEPGSTEPWVSDLVGMFVKARGARVVLETGSFMGRTSRVIADTLAFLGGGIFHVVELDALRAGATQRRLEAYPNVEVRIHVIDVLAFLRTTDQRFDVAFIDDNHEKKHVTHELMMLLPKMNPGGLILLHDVFGACDLQTVVRQFGGYSIDLPRLGPAGGLGIIQVPT